MGNSVVSVAAALALILACADGARRQITASVDGGVIHSTLVGRKVSDASAHG
jgi:hypothetical protein